MLTHVQLTLACAAVPVPFALILLQRTHTHIPSPSDTPAYLNPPRSALPQLLIVQRVPARLLRVC